MPLSETLMLNTDLSLSAHLSNCHLYTPLTHWLAVLESYQVTHPLRNLAEVKAIAKRLAIDTSQRCVITVAGTNGKGSSVAMLEACLLAQGYRVAAYTSPHLMHYRERFRIQGHMPTDEAIVEAMWAVKLALQDEVLHYFDFTTLVGLYLFMQQPVDIYLLEVGLGGRLDAVNIVDADIAVITSIALDHIAELGSDREAIGFEKAGIMRENRPVVIGDPDPPKSIIQHAKQLSCSIFCAASASDTSCALPSQPTPCELLSQPSLCELPSQPSLCELPSQPAPRNLFAGSNHGESHLEPAISFFSFQQLQDSWHCQGQGWAYHDLPKPSLPIANAALVLQVLQCIKNDFPVGELVIRQSLANVQLMGRMQRIHESPDIWIDVAHNPAASLYVTTQFRALPVKPTIAVVGMMADKDITSTLLPWVDIVDAWYVVPLASSRAARTDNLALRLHELKVKSVYISESLASVLQKLAVSAQEQRVIVFGSFVLVSEALALYHPFCKREMGEHRTESHQLIDYEYCSAGDCCG